MWMDGKSANQIARQLGGVTRNAVIGKSHRLKLPHRTSNNYRTRIFVSFSYQLQLWPKKSSVKQKTASKKLIENFVIAKLLRIFPGSIANAIVEPTGPTVYRPVGWKLRSFAEFMYPPRTNEMIFYATLCDLQIEYCKALKLGRHRKAEWVRWRGYISFLSAVLAHAAISITKRVVDLWKAVS